jgi:hypothetical protein
VDGTSTKARMADDSARIGASAGLRGRERASIPGDLVSRARAALVAEHDPLAISGASAIDAIVVPAARPVNGLQEAIGLAAGTGAFLLVVCSHAAAAPAAAGAMARAGHEHGMVVDLTRAWSHPLLELSTSRVAEASWGWPRRDLDLKRNLGLLLARLVGWRRLFFLDDDLRGVGVARLRRAAALLDRYAAVGLRATAFPDNSVVRHADRLAGGTQDVFVSGGALAVDCAVADGFFPGIYGEDWFFLFPLLARGPIAALGTVSQPGHDPFDPRRAAREEFGDLLAEGVLDRLLARGSLGRQGERRWRRAKADRDRFLSDVIRRLRDHPPAPAAARAEAAVQAARARLDAISPASCAGFMSAWRADLRSWDRRIAGLPAGMSPAEAAAWLGLPVLAPASELVVPCS